MAKSSNRSPRGKPDTSRLTRLVQTLITPAAAEQMVALIEESGDNESAYVRRLIYSDLAVHQGALRRRAESAKPSRTKKDS